MKRRNIILALCTMLAMSLCGCGNDKEDKTTEDITEISTTENVTTVEVTTEAIESTEATTEATTEANQPADIKIAVVGDGLEESQEYYENMYREILDSYYVIVTGNMDTYDYIEGSSGIGEIVMSGSENTMDTTGYTFVDCNNDGIAELVIGAISEEKEGKYYGQYLYSVYTYKDMPYLILEGWSRNRCFLLNDGTFYSEGSNGAMYSVFENYVLGQDEIELTCLDYYFSKEKGESIDDIGFFHNTTGEWEVSVSEEIDEESYWNINVAYSERTIPLELKPFAKYEYVGNGLGSENVSVEWITKDELHESQIGNYVAETSEYEVIAAITAQEDIMNLKILSLTYEDVDDMGNIVFSIEELYTYGDLEAGRPFAITITMPGTIPSYGISYETADGVTHYYAISESGMDGSAILIEFEQ